jgi:POT family proton-dependent oligopeptide transporter
MSSPTLPPESAPTTGPRDDRFPPGIPYIVGNEAAERFSYYGMRQILYVYLLGLFIGMAAENTVPAADLADAKVRATQWSHLFYAGVYLFPMIGGILADRFIGKYRVIFWVSLLYVAGHGTLALAGRLGNLGQLDAARLTMLAGLILIAVGAGGIKPCVAANVGDQFTAGNAHLLARIFQIFYFVINFGSFFATALTPWLYQRFGAEVAFAVPGVLMGVAAYVFWLGRRRFVHVPARPGGKLGALDFAASALLATPLLLAIYVAAEESNQLVSAVLRPGSGALLRALQDLATGYAWAAIAGALALAAGLALAQFRQQRAEDAGFLSVLLYCWRRRGSRSGGQDFWTPARQHFGEEAADGPPAVLRLLLVFSMVSVFWALFDQHSSTWIEQARSMKLDLTVPVALWDFWLLPAIIAASLLGLVWMQLWVSNRPPPRRITLLVSSAFVLWGLCAAVAQLAGAGSRSLTLLPAQLGALNPLFVMIIIPLLQAGVYGPLDRRGRPLRPLQRMTLGMAFGALSFVAVALLQARISAAPPGTVSVLWQIIPFALLTIGEVLVSVTGLEFAYTQAPRAMKSTIMSFWMLTMTLGNVLVAFLAPLQKLSLANFFWLFAGLMAAATLLFALLASFYRGRTYLQSAAVTK